VHIIDESYADILKECLLELQMPYTSERILKLATGQRLDNSLIRPHTIIRHWQNQLSLIR